MRIKEEIISSKDNTLIKQLQKLEQSRERKKTGLFLAEGKKEIKLMLDNQYQIQTLVVSENTVFGESDLHYLQNIPRIVRISEKLFQLIAYRETTAEWLAVAKQPQHSLSVLRLPENPLVVVIESVEKPGNLGAILRTADAFAADAVVICEPLVDFYNPNTIRSSVGTLFGVQKAAGSNDEVWQWLQTHKFNVFTTFIEDAQAYYDQNYTVPTALIFGTEAVGLSAFWRKKEVKNTLIPMRGQNDSLNVSVACAVILSEAVRQRKGSCI